MAKRVGYLTADKTITGGAGLTAVSGMDVTLGVGTWKIKACFSYTTSGTNAFSSQIRHAGTVSVAQYKFIVMSNAAGFVVSNANTALATNLGSSTNAGPMVVEYEGFITVTASGVFGVSATFATSGSATINKLGSWIECEQWGS